ncbi:MAG: hypothetical protein VKL98_04400 [Cyanobacteriota bacterium]|nr:hypothetical protein [Cyanobacteriota bacterium]
MKLILSRKGFDSCAGGVPSPIFPDGGILSLPIPDPSSPITYGDISYPEGSLGTLVFELTGGRLAPHYGAHLDPDLVADSLPRLPGWRGIFGQTGPAQGHLRNQRVGPGDLFLFFGLFHPVEKRQGAYGRVRDGRPYHLIWGWLQVAEVVPLGAPPPEGYDWAAYHPHCHRGRDPNNVLYIAQHHLSFDGLTEPLPGSGTFSHVSRERQLTASHTDQVSTWALPGWFYPGENRPPLTYHGDRRRWQQGDTLTLLRSVARGQEFVLDCHAYPEAIPWAWHLIRSQGIDHHNPRGAA